MKRGGWNKGKKMKHVSKYSRMKMAFKYWTNRIGEEAAREKVRKEWGEDFAF